MSFTALLHILAMANLVGLLIPEIHIGRQYRLSSSATERRALASLHLRLAQWAYIVLLFTVLTGVGRVMEVGYPWFAFGTVFWLAAKQTIGLLLVLWVLLTWPALRQAQKNLRSGHVSEAEVEIGLTMYERVKSRSHVVTGLAWLMAALAILKI